LDTGGKIGRIDINVYVPDNSLIQGIVTSISLQYPSVPVNLNFGTNPERNNSTVLSGKILTTDEVEAEDE